MITPNVVPTEKGIFIAYGPYFKTTSIMPRKHVVDFYKLIMKIIRPVKDTRVTIFEKIEMEEKARKQAVRNKWKKVFHKILPHQT